jgi:hypothetical protein
MAELSYIVGRKAYARPQGILLANNSGYISQGKRIPEGNEFEDFIILSDDNRGPINFEINRLERRERTVNGRMRSYHIADKLNISVSWDMLPSRGFSVQPTFQNESQANPGSVTNLVTTTVVNETTRPVSPFGSPYYQDQQYTSDGGVGGVEILDWYETYTGSFWAFLSYDNYKDLGGDRDRLSEYSEVVEVFFSSFDYSVEKRGGSNFDFWNISFSLEEV